MTLRLLHALGYEDTVWRRGTDLRSTTADSGRDIEAKFHRTDPDGTIVEDRWFFEAKHYKGGIPPEKLASAFTWAEAEKPSTLVIVTNSFLTNGARDWIESWKRSHSASFNVRVWDRPRLEELLLQNPDILNEFMPGPPTTRAIWTQALNDWRERLLLASRDRLELFYSATEELEFSYEELYFLLRSEMFNGSLEERDWLGAIGPKDWFALYAIACRLTFREMLQETAYRPSWVRYNPVPAELLFVLMPFLTRTGFVSLLWDPFRILQHEEESVRRVLNRFYRTQMLPLVLQDLLDRLLDICSDGCSKVSWPTATERSSPRGFIIIESTVSPCRLSLKDAEGGRCPVLFDRDRLTSKPTRKAIAESASILLEARKKIEGLESN